MGSDLSSEKVKCFMNVFFNIILTLLHQIIIISFLRKKIYNKLINEIHCFSHLGIGEKKLVKNELHSTVTVSKVPREIARMIIFCSALVG